MHIVVAVFGLVRSLSHTLPSIHQFCLDSIQSTGYTYEVIIHTYQFAGTYKNLRNKESALELNFSDWKLLHPSNVKIDDQDKFDSSVDLDQYNAFGDPWHNNYESMKNHIRALNSLYQVTLMLETLSLTKQIDGVVFLRPDVEYISELPIYLLPHPFEKPTLFVPDFHRSCNGGEFNDRMAMGDLRAALIYGKKFEYAMQYSKIHPMHSESFTYYYLKVVNNLHLTVVEVPFRFRRIRSGGQTHPRDVAVPEPLSQYKEDPAIIVTGHTKHRSKSLIALYRVLETLTFHKVYIWNHGDESNIHCHPNVPYVDYAGMMKLKEQTQGIYPMNKSHNFNQAYSNSNLNSNSNTNSNSNSNDSYVRYTTSPFIMDSIIPPQLKINSIVLPLLEIILFAVILCMCIIYFSYKTLRVKSKVSK